MDNGVRIPLVGGQWVIEGGVFKLAESIRFVELRATHHHGSTLVSLFDDDVFLVSRKSKERVIGRMDAEMSGTTGNILKGDTTCS